MKVVQTLPQADLNAVPAAAKRCLQPRSGDLCCQAWADETRAQRQNIGVVMLAAVEGCGMVVAHGCPHALDLVGGHTRADHKYCLHLRQ